MTVVPLFLAACAFAQTSGRKERETEFGLQAQQLQKIRFSLFAFRPELDST
jgi:hypothetical protein